MVWVPIELMTASKEATNFVSRSRTRNRKRRPPSSRAAAKLRALWVTHTPVGLAVTPRDVHDAPLHLDHEEHVVAAEDDAVDGEEVRGQDPFRLGREGTLTSSARPVVVPVAARCGEAPWPRSF